MSRATTILALLQTLLVALIAALFIFAVLCTSALGAEFTFEMTPVHNTRVSLSVPFKFTLAPDNWKVSERYSYWRPEFPSRWSSPEKEKAAAAFLGEYDALIRRISILIDQINNSRLNRSERQQASAEYDAKIERVKALEPEISLFFRH